MSLNFDSGDTVAYQTARPFFTDGEEKQPVEWTDFTSNRHAILMLLMSSGFPPGPWVITESNHVEVFKRLYILERVHGCMQVMFKEDVKTDYYLTLEIVKSFIGLHANVGNKTNAAFNKHLALCWRRRAEDNIRAAG